MPIQENEDLLKIWAKLNPFHPLIFHLIDVGCVARAILSTNQFKNIVKFLRIKMNFDKDNFESWLAYIISLHDIGKCNVYFQVKANDEIINGLKALGFNFNISLPKGFQHSAFGGIWIRKLLLNNGWNKKCANTIMKSVRGHHGYFQKEYLERTETQEELWDNYRKVLNKILKNLFNPADWKAEKFESLNLVGVLLTSLIVLSDWIASNLDLFKYDKIMSETDDPQKYFDLSNQNANNIISLLGFDQSISWDELSRFQQIWPQFKDKYPIQELCEEIIIEKNKKIRDIGLVIIEAPTGEGKTESAIYIATQLISNSTPRGMYIALPTIVTSNQMYSRVKEFILSCDPAFVKGVRLVHGMAWIHDEIASRSFNITVKEEKEDEIIARGWFYPKKRSLFSTYSVGTIDQVLMSVLHVKFGFLRLLGMSNKVIIIDEVHAYDAYMNKIITRMLEWASALNIPVIMLSATLPELKKNNLIQAYLSNSHTKEKELINYDANNDYPLITITSKNGTILKKSVPKQKNPITRQVNLFFRYGLLENFQEIAPVLIDSAKKNQCVCAILNTVNNAQEVYKIIKEQLVMKNLKIPVILFHSRFTVKRRKDIEQLVLNNFDKKSKTRPKSAILIATQVIEQSLDLDFDEMFSEIAPIDLLIQRIGRLHRHYRPKRYNIGKPNFHVFVPQKGSYNFLKTEFIYSKYILLRTFLFLKTKKIITIPNDMRNFIEEVYNEELTIFNNSSLSIDEIKKIQERWINNIKTEENQARIYLIPRPHSRDFSYALRSGSPFNEDEGGVKNYFNAKTRLGDHRIQIILNNNNEFDSILSQKNRPSKEKIQNIVMNSVSLPRYWFDDIREHENFLIPSSSPRWLPNRKILSLINNVWKCYSRNGKVRIIINDNLIGVNENVE